MLPYPGLQNKNASSQRAAGPLRALAGTSAQASRPERTAGTFTGEISQPTRAFHQASRRCEINSDWDDGTEAIQGNPQACNRYCHVARLAKRAKKTILRTDEEFFHSSVDD